MATLKQNALTRSRLRRPNEQHQPRAKRVGCMLKLGSAKPLSCAAPPTEKIESEPDSAASRNEREEQDRHRENRQWASPTIVQTAAHD